MEKRDVKLHSVCIVVAVAAILGAAFLAGILSSDDTSTLGAAGYAIKDTLGGLFGRAPSSVTIEPEPTPKITPPPRQCDTDEDGYSSIGGGDCCYGGFTRCASTPDCNDHDQFINPDISEVCFNGIDDNCDGLIDCAQPECCSDVACSSFAGCIAIPSCVDLDKDLYGVGDTRGCIGEGQDCNDDNRFVSPAAAEQCGNAIDYDCDSLVDCADPDCIGNVDCQGVSIFLGSRCGNGYLDGDEECDFGSVPKTGTSCLDTETLINGVCVDNLYSCGGSAIGSCDASCTCSNPACYFHICGDGFVQNPPEGCDDGNLASGDGCDSSCHCDDLDLDGFYPLTCVSPIGSDCDDGNSAVNPGEVEICGDLLDNDCNGLIDAADPACSGSPTPTPTPTPSSTPPVGGGECTNACSAGTTRCNGNLIEHCGDYDSDPCLEWGGAQACSFGCAQGQCIGSCNDLCIPGERQCISNGQYQTCEASNVQGGCDGWGPAEDCGPGNFCQSGACYDNTCNAQCLLGATQCASETQYQTCDALLDGICNGWGTLTNCPPAMICSQGQCILNAQCASQCTLGTTQCSGLGVQACVPGEDTFACNTWEYHACATGESCNAGSCISQECDPTCTPGKAWCEGSGQAVTCTYSSSGCLVRARTFCTEDLVCHDGACVTLEETGILSPEEGVDATLLDCAPESAELTTMHMQELPRTFLLPEGYVEIVEPFKASCTSGNTVSFSVPNTMTDIRLLYCTAEGCTQTRPDISLNDPCTIQAYEKTLINEQPSSSVIITDVIDGTTVARVRKAVEGRVFDVTEHLQLQGTLMDVEVGPNARGLLALSFPFSGSTVPSRVALYAKTQDGTLPLWVYLGGSINAQNRIITVTLDNAQRYAFEGAIQFAVIPVECEHCDENILQQVYAPKEPVRRAIILVHGWGTSSRRFRQLIDDMRQTQQPWQIWTFDYPGDQSIAQSAQQFSRALEGSAASFDEVVIVAHSLGGLVAQRGVRDAYVSSYEGRELYTFVPKIRKMILIGVPNTGLVRNDIYELLRARIQSIPLAEDFFDIPQGMFEDLKQPQVVPRVPGIDYYVIAGTRDYSFTKLMGVFTQSDGIVPVRSAQRIGEIPADDTCHDYFEMYLTHTDLLDNPEATRIIARLAAKDLLPIGTSGLLGYNQVITAKLPQCDSQGYYWIVGKPVSLAEAPDPCNCGNGVCGIGEDEASCPVDCGRFMSQEESCVVLSAVRFSTIILLAVLLLIGILAHFATQWISKDSPYWLITYTLLTCVAAMSLMQDYACIYPTVTTPHMARYAQSFGIALLFLLGGLILFLDRAKYYIKSPHGFRAFTTLAAASASAVLISMAWSPFNTWLFAASILGAAAISAQAWRVRHPSYQIGRAQPTQKELARLSSLGLSARELLRTAQRAYRNGELKKAFHAYHELEGMYNRLLYEDRKDIYAEMVFLYHDLELAREKLYDTFERDTISSKKQMAVREQRWETHVRRQDRSGTREEAELLDINRRLANLRLLSLPEAEAEYTLILQKYNALPSGLKLVCYEDVMKGYELVKRMQQRVHRMGKK